MLWLSVPPMLGLLAHGAVFHEVADLATDSAAAVIWSHFSFSEDFRVKKVLHLTGIHERKGFDWCAKQCSPINESLHDEVSHFPGQTSTKIVVQVKRIFNDNVFGCPLLVEGGETAMLPDTHNMLSEVKVLSIKSEQAEPQLPHRLSVPPVLWPATGQCL